MYVPDHPDIVSAERTGYPRRRKIYCDECSKDITDDIEIYEDTYHQHLCKECLLYFHRKE